MELKQRPPNIRLVREKNKDEEVERINVQIHGRNSVRSKTTTDEY